MIHWPKPKPSPAAKAVEQANRDAQYAAARRAAGCKW